jgi:hypothetical protein
MPVSCRLTSDGLIGELLCDLRVGKVAVSWRGRQGGRSSSREGHLSLQVRIRTLRIYNQPTKIDPQKLRVVLSSCKRGRTTGITPFHPDLSNLIQIITDPPSSTNSRSSFSSFFELEAPICRVARVLGGLAVANGCPFSLEEASGDIRQRLTQLFISYTGGICGKVGRASPLGFALRREDRCPTRWRRTPR